MFYIYVWTGLLHLSEMQKVDTNVASGEGNWEDINPAKECRWLPSMGRTIKMTSVSGDDSVTWWKISMHISWQQYQPFITKSHMGECVRSHLSSFMP